MQLENVNSICNKIQQLINPWNPIKLNIQLKRRKKEDKIFSIIVCLCNENPFMDI